MKSFKRFVSEVAEPKSSEEKRFKDQHEVDTVDHPVATEFQRKGVAKPKAKRKADQEGDANYDKAYAFKEEAELEESWGKKVKKEELVGGQKKLDHNKNGKLDAHDFKMMRKKKNEEVEQIDEISKDLAGRYKAAATRDKEIAGRNTERHVDRGNYDAAGKQIDRQNKRIAGIKKANKVLNKEETDLEEGHSTWEVSFKTQGHKSQTVKGRNTAEAIKKAEKRATAAHPKKQLAMYKGIKKVSEEVEIEEAHGVGKQLNSANMEKAMRQALKNKENFKGGKVLWNFVDADVYMDIKPSRGQSNSFYKMFDRIADKLSKELNLEESEQIDELSQDTLRNYHGKAGADLQDKRKKLEKGTLTSKDYKQGRNRAAGLNRAANKMEEVEVNETTNSAVKKPVNITGTDGKTRTVMKTTRANQTDEKGQDKIKTNESFDMLDETFKQGVVKLNDKSQVILKKEDADALNKLFKGLSGSGKKKMSEDAMKDKKSFDEILGFAKQAL